MTRSLKVNQLAKSISSALGQNIDLLDVIALGHDVGHTPFSQIVERTMAKIISDDTGIPENEKVFKHNLQALRLRYDLEKGVEYPNHKGLNFTRYTLLNHITQLINLTVTG